MFKTDRRGFLKATAYLATILGLDLRHSKLLAQGVKEALAKRKRLPVIWLQFQECTGCTESLIKTMHPDISKIVLNLISIDYQETILAAAGFQAEAVLKKSMKANAGEYILCVEGGIPTADGGQYCVIGGRTAQEILKEAAAGAKAVIAWGTCASFGGLQAAKPNPTGAKPVSDLVKGKPIINVSGCPPISEVMAAVVAHYLVFGKLPNLDQKGRPTAFYGSLLHDTCYRRAHYDENRFAKSYDDPNGYCLFQLGCKGPLTNTACGVLGHSAGLSHPVRSGHPCLGCTEPNFWDDCSPFYKSI